jgi:hypothetical protein
LPGVSSAPDPADAVPAGEIETLIATFVADYEAGDADALIESFDERATTPRQRGRAAIHAEYKTLFRSTLSRRLSLSALRWTHAGEGADARGIALAETRWADGRETRHRQAIEIAIVRREGRAVIVNLSQRPLDE